MCTGSNKYQKKAAEAQTQALEQLAAAQNLKTTDSLSKTNGTVKTNKNAKKRDMYSLRVPLNNSAKAITGGGLGNSYGLNIPL